MFLALAQLVGAARGDQPLNSKSDALTLCHSAPLGQFVHLISIYFRVFTSFCFDNRISSDVVNLCQSIIQIHKMQNL